MFTRVVIVEDLLSHVIVHFTGLLVVVAAKDSLQVVTQVNEVAGCFECCQSWCHRWGVEKVEG